MTTAITSPSAPTATSTESAPVPAAVSARSLSKVYGRGSTAVHALRPVDVDIERGRFTAIMRPSGSGKSTLLRLLAGLDGATGGRVWIGDHELGLLNDDRLTRLRRDLIGFVFQSFNLVPTLTAGEIIPLLLDLAGRGPDQA